MKPSRAFVALAIALATGCGGPDYLSVEELMDPETCMDCHPNHYEQWSGSMHAYAADDPVFLAMNERGQRETGGQLGDFCVGCHAPMAVRTGATTDGLNLAELPQHLKGVTCYFCHQVESVEGTHNNPLTLAMDQTMRGGLEDPVANDAHATSYSRLHDRRAQESSNMCGACHDIVTPAGVHLERTFAEWQDSVFATDDPLQHLSCGKCHMKGDVPGVVADYPDVPLRMPREHTFAGVDIALTPWPQRDEQRALVQAELDNTLGAQLCVTPVAGGVQVDYVLDNVAAGHMWPSGAGQDRRAWAEVQAFIADEAVFQSGVVAEGQAVVEVAESDPNLWQMRDFTFDGNGQVAHMFWDVAEVESALLPGPVTSDPNDPRFDHSVTRSYTVEGPTPDRITAMVHIRPMGLDVLADLVDSGDLDPAIAGEIPTFTLEGSSLEWTSADGFECITR